MAKKNAPISYLSYLQNKYKAKGLNKKLPSNPKQYDFGGTVQNTEALASGTESTTGMMQMMGQGEGGGDMMKMISGGGEGGGSFSTADTVNTGVDKLVNALGGDSEKGWAQSLSGAAGAVAGYFTGDIGGMIDSGGDFWGGIGDYADEDSKFGEVMGAMESSSHATGNYMQGDIAGGAEWTGEAIRDTGAVFDTDKLDKMADTADEYSAVAGQVGGMVQGQMAKNGGYVGNKKNGGYKLQNGGNLQEVPELAPSYDFPYEYLDEHTDNSEERLQFYGVDDLNRGAYPGIFDYSEDLLKYSDFQQPIGTSNAEGFEESDFKNKRLEGRKRRRNIFKGFRKDYVDDFKSKGHHWNTNKELFGPDGAFQDKLPLEYGGPFPQFQNGGNLDQFYAGQASLDSLNFQRDKSIAYETVRGSKEGNPLAYYSDPKYTEKYDTEVTPLLGPYKSAIEKGEAGDFIYNTGKNPQKYALQEYYRKYEPSLLDEEGKWSGRNTLSDTELNKLYLEKMEGLKENDRRILMNKGRDWYYKNTAPIGNYDYGYDEYGNMIRDKFGAWSPAYQNTWFGRIHNTNDMRPFVSNDPRFNTPIKDRTVPIQRQNGGPIVESNTEQPPVLNSRQEAMLIPEPYPDLEPQLSSEYFKDSSGNLVAINSPEFQNSAFTNSIINSAESLQNDWTTTDEDTGIVTNISESNNPEALDRIWRSTTDSTKNINDRIKNRTAWSAATISTIMKDSNVPFRGAIKHANYVSDAVNTDKDYINSTSKYNSHNTATTEGRTDYKVGDILYTGRDAKKSGNTKDWTFDQFEKYFKKNPGAGLVMHSDIIVGKGKDDKGEYILVAGGNTSGGNLKADTYSNKKKVYLNEDGSLKNSRYKGVMVLNPKYTESPKDKKLAQERNISEQIQRKKTEKVLLEDLAKEEQIARETITQNIPQYTFNPNPYSKKYGGYSKEGYKIDNSKIHGKGIFATKNYKKGESISNTPDYINDKNISNVSFYHNHSEKPNIINIKKGKFRNLIAHKNIKKGEELTSNYRNVPHFEQPEDFKKYGGYNKGGYKRNSPDVNNPYNVINSGNITMKGVDFPVRGTDNLGNTQFMTPGNDYQFPGNTVIETPIKYQNGGPKVKEDYEYYNQKDYNKALAEYNKKVQLNKQREQLNLIYGDFDLFRDKNSANLKNEGYDDKYYRDTEGTKYKTVQDELNFLTDIRDKEYSIRNNYRYNTAYNSYKKYAPDIVSKYPKNVTDKSSEEMNDLFFKLTKEVRNNVGDDWKNIYAETRDAIWRNPPEYEKYINTASYKDADNRKDYLTHKYKNRASIQDLKKLGYKGEFTIDNAIKGKNYKQKIADIKNNFNPGILPDSWNEDITNMPIETSYTKGTYNTPKGTFGTQVGDRGNYGKYTKYYDNKYQGTLSPHWNLEELTKPVLLSDEERQKRLGFIPSKKAAKIELPYSKAELTIPNDSYSKFKYPKAGDQEIREREVDMGAKRQEYDPITNTQISTPVKTSQQYRHIITQEEIDKQKEFTNKLIKNFPYKFQYGGTNTGNQGFDWGQQMYVKGDPNSQDPDYLKAKDAWANKIKSLNVDEAIQNASTEEIEKLYNEGKIVNTVAYDGELIPSHTLPEFEFVDSDLPYYDQLTETQKENIADSKKPTDPAIIKKYGYDPYKNNPMLRSANIHGQSGYGFINPKTGQRNKSFTQSVKDDIVKPGMTVAAGALAAPALEFIGPGLWNAANTNLLGASGTSLLDAAGYYGAYEGSKALPGDIEEFAENPSWSNAGSIGLDLLGIGGGAYSAANLLNPTKGIPKLFTPKSVTSNKNLTNIGDDVIADYNAAMQPSGGGGKYKPSAFAENNWAEFYRIKKNKKILKDWQTKVQYEGVGKPIEKPTFIGPYANVDKEVKAAIAKLNNPKAAKKLEKLGIKDHEDFMRYLRSDVRYVDETGKSGSVSFKDKYEIIDESVPGGIRTTTEPTTVNLGSRDITTDMHFDYIDDVPEMVLDHEFGHVIQAYLKEKGLQSATNLDKEATLFFKNNKIADDLLSDNAIENYNYTQYNNIARGKKLPMNEKSWSKDYDAQLKALMPSMDDMGSGTPNFDKFNEFVTKFPNEEAYLAAHPNIRTLEPLAHLRELRTQLLQDGAIKNFQDDITSEVLLNFWKTDAGKQNRILSFMKAGPDQVKGLVNLINKTPVVAGAIGTAGVGTAVGSSGNNNVRTISGDFRYGGTIKNNRKQFQNGGLDYKTTDYVDSVFNANMDKRWVQRLYEKNPEFYLKGKKEPSTHYMASGDGYVFPTVIENSKGELEYNPEKGRDLGIKLPNDEIASWFGENYKIGTNILQEKEFKKKQNGGVISKEARDWYNSINKQKAMQEQYDLDVASNQEQYDKNLIGYNRTLEDLDKLRLLAIAQANERIKSLSDRLSNQFLTKTERDYYYPGMSDEQIAKEIKSMHLEEYNQMLKTLEEGDTLATDEEGHLIDRGYYKILPDGTLARSSTEGWLSYARTKDPTMLHYQSKYPITAKPTKTTIDRDPFLDKDFGTTFQTKAKPGETYLEDYEYDKGDRDEDGNIIYHTAQKTVHGSKPLSYEDLKILIDKENQNITKEKKKEGKETTQIEDTRYIPEVIFKYGGPYKTKAMATKYQNGGRKKKKGEKRRGITSTPSVSFQDGGPLIVDPNLVDPNIINDYTSYLQQYPFEYRFLKSSPINTEDLLLPEEEIILESETNTAKHGEVDFNRAVPTRFQYGGNSSKKSNISLINKNVNLNEDFIANQFDDRFSDTSLNRRDKGFTGISGDFVLPDINKRSALSQSWSPFVSGEIGQRRFQSRPNNKSPFTNRSAVEGSANIGYTLKPDTYNKFNPTARGSVGFNYYDNKFRPTMGTTLGLSYQNKGRAGDLNLEGGIGGTGVWGPNSKAAYMNTHNTGPYLKGSYTFNDANRKNAWLKNLGISAGIKKDGLTKKTDTSFGLTKKFQDGGLNTVGNTREQQAAINAQIREKQIAFPTEYYNVQNAMDAKDLWENENINDYFGGVEYPNQPQLDSLKNVYQNLTVPLQNGGNPQAPQQGGQEQQIIQQVAGALQQGMPPEEIMGKLIEMGMAEEQAGQLIQGVMQQMQSQQQQSQQMAQQQPQQMAQQGYQQYQNGGEMNSIPTTEFNGGGSHEENPNGGIPIGSDALVEEGELKITVPGTEEEFIVSPKIMYKKNDKEAIAVAEELGISEKEIKKYAGKDMVSIFKGLLRSNSKREGDTIEENSKQLEIMPFIELHNFLTERKNAKEEAEKQANFQEDMGNMMEQYPEYMQAMQQQTAMEGAQAAQQQMAQQQGPSPEEQAMMEQQMMAQQGGMPQGGPPMMNFGGYMNYMNGGRKQYQGGGHYGVDPVGPYYDQVGNLISDVSEMQKSYNPTTGEYDPYYTHTGGDDDNLPVRTALTKDQITQIQMNNLKTTDDDLLGLEDLDEATALANADKIIGSDVVDTKGFNQAEDYNIQGSNPYIQAAPMAYNLWQGLKKEDRLNPQDYMNRDKVNPYKMNIDPQLNAINRSVAGAQKNMANVGAGNAGQYFANMGNTVNQAAAATDKIQTNAENANAQNQMRADLANQQAAGMDNQMKFRIDDWNARSKQAKEAHLGQFANQLASADTASTQNEMGAMYANMQSPDFNVDYKSSGDIFKEDMGKIKTGAQKLYSNLISEYGGYLPKAKTKKQKKRTKKNK